jgi:hypothetical protein
VGYKAAIIESISLQRMQSSFCQHVHEKTA